MRVKLFMLMLGAKPQGRHTEQHDIFFVIDESINDVKPNIKAFWPEAKDKIHIDAWREVTSVDGYQINVVEKQADLASLSKHKLFFVNLGGYQENRFEEQHYVLLTVKEDKSLAFKEAKQTLFYQHNHIPGGTSHIDDKYGVDVDDLYEIEDILSAEQKEKYRIEIAPIEGLAKDEFHLGYLKLSQLK
ncbi:MAG: DUF1543 domain-containing protein [Sphingobacteriales bacterium]